MHPLIQALIVGQVAAFVVFAHEGIVQLVLYRATRSPELRIYAEFSLWSALFTLCFLVFPLPLPRVAYLLSLHAMTIFGVLVMRSYLLAIDAFLRAESVLLRKLSKIVLVIAVWPLASGLFVLAGGEPFFVFDREGTPRGIVVAFVDRLEPRNQVHSVHALAALALLCALLGSLLSVVLRSRPRDPFIVAGVFVTCASVGWELVTLLLDLRYGVPIIFAANLIEAVRITYVSMLRAGRDRALLRHEIARQRQVIEGQQTALAESAPLAHLGILTREIGHELRNPLASALLFVQAAERRVRAGKLDVEPLEQARTALLQASAVATALQHPWQEGPNDRDASCELGDAIRDAVAIAGPRLAPFRDRVLISLVPLPAVRGQRSELIQVVLNLIMNACDACESIPDAWLRIEAWGGPSGVRMTIADAGPRPSDEVAARMFLADFSTKHPSLGNGLGLAITREILRKLGGRIALDPEEQNTRFLVDLKL